MLTELHAAFVSADPLISHVVVICAGIVAILVLRRRDV
jgi:hypothetical protein